MLYSGCVEVSRQLLGVGSLYHVGSEDRIQALRLCSKRFYLLNHLTGPHFQLIFMQNYR